MNALYPQGAWDLDDRLTVVLFAGMGGACDGLEAAGFPVHLAINHDPLAIAVHEKRHPHTRHLRSDVFEVCPRDATGGRGVRILHASPDCTHFSVAKGSKPVSKRRRSLAWVVCRWAGQVRPETITMENVREITTWGPLVAKRDPATGRVLRLDGTMATKGERVPVEHQWLIPNKRHKGRIWRAWLKHMRGLRYSFEYKVINCADHGIPTIRTRFFGVAQADGGAIVFPERTHAPRAKRRALKLKPWVGFDGCIDWSLPVKSIFNRKKPLAEATLRRIARGVMRYVVTAKEPFIVPITHAGDLRVNSIKEPGRTWTTAHRGELALVVPHIAGVGGRMGQSVERSADEPMQSATTKPDSVIVTAHLAGLAHGDSGGRREYSADEPMLTFHAGGNNTALVSAHLTKFRTGATGADLREPMPVYSANSFHDRPGCAPPMGVAAVHLEAFNENAAGAAPDAPIGAMMAGAPRHALVAACLERQFGKSVGADVSEPAPTIKAGGGGGTALIAATMVQTGYGERDGQAPRSLDLEEPGGTLVAGGGKAALVAAFLAQHNNDEKRPGGVNPGREAGEPASTLTGSPQQAVVAATLGTLRGTNIDGGDLCDPAPAQSAGGLHEMLILPFLQAYYQSGSEGQRADDPLRALTAKARHGLVTVEVDGVTMVITDICMRMIDPLEGAKAHGFDPKSLLHEIDVTDKRGRTVRRRPTKTEIGHLVGNSVPPRMVQLLAELNVRRALAPQRAEVAG